MTKTFFCLGHLEDSPPKEQSPGSRYCQSCYDFLLNEAKLATCWEIPEWIPVTPSEPLSKPVQSVLGGQKCSDDLSPSKISTLRGNYKKQELPEDYVRQLANDGMGSKLITARLKVEHGIHISYKTIQSVLKGKRKVAATIED